MKEILASALVFVAMWSSAQNRNNTVIDGYRGIWFELNQKYDYGDKYSGALATYTAKHVPLAIYSEEADKTFFVYGGTTSETERYLLCMIGEYDHQSGLVSKPTVVYDKLGVDDPHDNPSLMIDDEGYIWVFVSGRNTRRMGLKMRSTEPYSIRQFETITTEEMTYPQPWKTNQGYLHLFTKYSGVRNLYFESSADGETWTEDRLLAAIPLAPGGKSGHYQTSACFKGEKVGTFFNRHPEGNVDQRTDLYYVETSDLEETWVNISGDQQEVPLLKQQCGALVMDYHKQKKNVYMKDMGFDSKGNPVVLYIRSNGYKPGPESTPYEWCVTFWDGKAWQTNVVTESDHNYDMGSLFIAEDNWSIVGPTEQGAQAWGVGGELAIWQSSDQGATWQKKLDVTKHSKRAHSYVRRPLNFKAPFCFFWADGHSHDFSKSELYFGNFDGTIYKLPYTMEGDFAKPERISQ